MNPRLESLHAYPFERLARLKSGVTPPAGKTHIALSIGEPKHPTPDLIRDTLVGCLDGLSSYPTTAGTRELREAVAEWLCQRFGLAPESLDPERHVLPVSGTREGLFAFAQCVVGGESGPLVLMPNPFYQIYEGAAILSGATPWYLPCVARTGLPDFESVPASVWRRCQLLYLCSPANPTGAVIEPAELQWLLSMADEFGFVIAADECYSEIYLDEDRPPVGLLQAAATAGRHDYRRCVVFHSLSKRSSVPGLRSGFVAGDADLLATFHRYRTYHGCAMPLYAQAASIAAWRDEAHVRDNRSLYRRKFDAVLPILAEVMRVERPRGGFYLWPETPISDVEFARLLFARQNVAVLPGSFLSRVVNGVNPGSGRVRIALVPPLDECVEAAERIRDLLGTLDADYP
ncbi:MAG: succinyldiaminopimelate transaminase [Gammaproteobacteria bacterium]|nr:succinyldiaminopimelate transaminase [Gammaproteobacteria bacterium]NIR83099.1 succinyldiaminopimelate transaminase [Gammaproteobacteria bacterium]NIR90761.1 succinyldiaminopimelate transaminase [Gammaproteobacteria bacterium]NIU04252.1 succinyldiaminopimelate transaminase [Gammaproteobacteria bacterium]NIV51544.1 succinyldiaminopimelate transaminase [Gammaproteobacteria bacterium]